MCFFGSTTFAFILRNPLNINTASEKHKKCCKLLKQWSQLKCKIVEIFEDFFSVRQATLERFCRSAAQNEMVKIFKLT